MARSPTCTICKFRLQPTCQLQAEVPFFSPAGGGPHHQILESHNKSFMDEDVYSDCSEETTLDEIQSYSTCKYKYFSSERIDHFTALHRLRGFPAIYVLLIWVNKIKIAEFYYVRSRSFWICESEFWPYVSFIWATWIRDRKNGTTRPPKNILWQRQFSLGISNWWMRFADDSRIFQNHFIRGIKIMMS